MSKVVSFAERYRKADRIMLGLLWLLFVYALGLAAWHDTWLQALFVGGGTVLLLSGLYQVLAGTRLMRSLIAAGMMVLTALHINQAQGMVEIHFGIFALLAVLGFYRDWLPIVVAAATIAVHHVLFHYLQHEGYPVFVMQQHGDWTMVVVHAIYVVVESTILVYLAVQGHAEASANQDVLDRMLAAAAQLSRSTAHQNASGARVPLSAHFDQFLEQVAGLVKGVVRDTRGLSDLGTDLSKASTTLENGAQSQLGEIARMTGAIEHMGAAMEEVITHVDAAVLRAEQAGEQVARGRETVDRARLEIVDLSVRIGTTDQAVQTFAEQAAKIGKVLDVIRGVAEQTNLLALNAAIEAARAGEQGRGFAVVADEVRSLAQKTSASTSEIQSIIEALQVGSREAATSMYQSREGVERCVGDSERACELLNEVVDGISSIRHLSGLIASTTRAQSEAGADIGNRLRAVQSIAQSNVENVGTLSISSARLPPLAARLEALGEAFQE